MTNLVIVTPSLNAYSETFIRVHIERLPAKVSVFYGGYFPVYKDDGSPIIPPFTLKQHIKETFLRRMKHFTWEDLRRYDLIRALRDYRADAVLAEYGPTGVAVMDACAEAGIPLIVHFHGFDAHNKETLTNDGLRYPELFSKASAIVAVSKEMVEELGNLGAPRVKIHYNPCGVDTAVFTQGNPESAPPLFIGVGRFVTNKGQYLTLLAFARVLEVVPEARLVMLGDGPLWEACVRLARVLGLKAVVSLPGRQPHEEVVGQMLGARALVHHSVCATTGDSEGTPVVVLEACASGLPVVATRIGGIPDVVIEGETGFLVEEGDVEGMAQAMIRLAKEPELAAKMGRAGRERVCAEFSMEKSIGNLWTIIEAAIDSGR